MRGYTPRFRELNTPEGDFHAAFTTANANVRKVAGGLERTHPGQPVVSEFVGDFTVDRLAIWSTWKCALPAHLQPIVLKVKKGHHGPGLAEGGSVDYRTFLLRVKTFSSRTRKRLDGLIAAMPRDSAAEDCRAGITRSLDALEAALARFLADSDPEDQVPESHPRQLDDVTRGTATTSEPIGSALDRLQTGPATRLSALLVAQRRGDIPTSPGVYTIWLDSQLLYVGISWRKPAETTNKNAKGVFGRLKTYYDGRRTADLMLALCDRFVIPTLTSVELESLGRGAFDLNKRTRTFAHERLTLRTLECSGSQARDIKRRIRRHGLPEAGRPLLNAL